MCPGKSEPWIGQTLNQEFIAKKRFLFLTKKTRVSKELATLTAENIFIFYKFLKNDFCGFPISQKTLLLFFAALPSTTRSRFRCFHIIFEFTLKHLMVSALQRKKEVFETSGRLESQIGKNQSTWVDGKKHDLQDTVCRKKADPRHLVKAFTKQFPLRHEFNLLIFVSVVLIDAMRNKIHFCLHWAMAVSSILKSAPPALIWF